MPSSLLPRLRHLIPLALACGAIPAVGQPAPTHPCAAVAEPAARLACYDRAFARPSAVAPAAAPPAAPVAPVAPAPAPAAADAAGFGLSQRTAPAELQLIESRLAEDFDGWGPQDRIRLLNGQVWEVIDGSSGSVGPQQRRVTIRRGSMGSYFMEFEGQKKSPRVRRVQ